MRRLFFLLFLVAVAAFSTAETGLGQGNQPAPAAAAATPRMADGHPDLNGYWYRRDAPINLKRDGESVIIGDNFASLRLINPGVPKYKPEFAAKVKELEKNQVYEDRTYTCGPPGSRGLVRRSGSSTPRTTSQFSTTT